MKKKYLLTAFAPVMALALIGVTPAFAHGMGWIGSSTATPQDIAKRQTDMFTQEAKLLGLTVDQVKEGWAQGMSLPEIATAHGISQTDLQKKITDARKQQLSETLKTLVGQGVITQKQADARLQAIQKRIENGEAKKITGMHRGMGFHGGMWF